MTCFNSTHSSYIGLIIANKKYSLKHTSTFEIGLNDFHPLIHIMLDGTYLKLPPKEGHYRYYKYFNDILKCFETACSYQNKVR